MGLIPTPQETQAAKIHVSPNNGGTPAPTPAPAAPVVPNTTKAAVQAAPYASVTPVQNRQPATEPAVVSSSTIPDTIAKNTQTLKDLSSKGTYVGQDGNLYHSDGSLVPAPAFAETGPNNTWNAGGQQYGAEPNYTGGDESDPDTKQINDLLAGLKQSLDSSTKSQVDTIEQQHALLTGQQQDANTRAGASRQSALLASGSRYTPFDASGTMLAQTSYGLQAIAALDAQENAAISAAKKAQNDGDQQIADKAIGYVQQLRTQKQAAAQKLIDSQSTALQAQQKQQQQSIRDTGIADLVTQGMTDPAQILSTLNANGGDYTADDVAGVLKQIATNTGAVGIKGLTGDVGNFYALKQTPGALPSSILALPDEQQLPAYISMVNEAKKGVVSPATGAPSAGGAVAPNDATGTNMPVVGFDQDNGPNKQDQVAFLDALPGGESGSQATLVRSLADYSINPNSIPTRQYKGVGGLTQADALALVKQYDPSYDEKQFATRAAMQKNVETGAYSQVINAANTLIAHLGELKKAQQQLPGGQGGTTSAGVDLGSGRNMPFFNSLMNRGSQMFGGAGVNNFNTARGAIATEAARIYKGTGAPSESEITDWQKSLSADSSNEQINGAIKMISSLMAGKLSTLSQNYKGVMGKTGGFSILTPQSIKTLQGLAIDPSDLDPTYSPESDIGSSNSLQAFLQSAPGATAAPSGPVDFSHAP